MKTIEKFMNYRLFTLSIAGFTIMSCSNNDNAVPPEENEVEVITDVTLVFTNNADETDVVRASAQDPDGEGIQELQVLDEIDLGVDKTYTLTFEIFNNLEATPGENIGEEILNEDNDHQFFFEFTLDAFDSPTGNGNIDTASDPLNYNDRDENENPVGLSTTWTTPATGTTGGIFTVRLKHQPGIKTSTTGASNGDTDFDLDFVLNIQ